ncbi:AMIN-like domain-containing (lipo)protein [Ruania alba]|uniref:AMIN-like domain-containing protein n=1 Tax=Ruania alba TaxID=648782 RepID=A0A1H5MQY1_9MICO|nr:hypothetical protein [Ruania alba]SEE91147.1 hypothetical protein SAMN04488554_3535 [Ruania alba]
MNVDDELHKDADRSRRMEQPNPLTGRVDEIAARVRHRRRMRAGAGAVVAVAAVVGGAWGVTQTGLLGWEAAPPATPSETTPHETPSETTEPTGEPTTDPTDGDPPPFPADPTPVSQELQGNPDLLLVDARAGEHDGYDRMVLEFSGSGTPGWQAEYVDSAAEAGSGAPITLDGDGLLRMSLEGTRYPEDEEDLFTTPALDVGGAAIDQAYVGSTFEGQTQVVLGVADPEAPFRVFSLTDPQRVVIDVQETEAEEPTGDPAGPLEPAPEFEPACGDTWSPPELNTGLTIDADWGAGPFTASPDGASGGISTDAVITNTSSEALSHRVYTWTVLVRDGAVYSPELLGSDAVGDVDLAPGGTTTFSAGHQLWEYCEPGWTGVGPSVPAGTYTAYAMLMDLDAYQDSGTRNVLAVSPGVEIEVAQG